MLGFPHSISRAGNLSDLKCTQTTNHADQGMTRNSMRGLEYNKGLCSLLIALARLLFPICTKKQREK